jgi:hypothetical protein
MLHVAASESMRVAVSRDDAGDKPQVQKADLSYRVRVTPGGDWGMRGEFELAKDLLQGLKPRRKAGLMSDLKVRPLKRNVDGKERTADPSHRSQKVRAGSG